MTSCSHTNCSVFSRAYYFSLITRIIIPYRKRFIYVLPMIDFLNIKLVTANSPSEILRNRTEYAKNKRTQKNKSVQTTMRSCVSMASWNINVHVFICIYIFIFVIGLNINYSIMIIEPNVLTQYDWAYAGHFGRSALNSDIGSSQTSLSKIDFGTLNSSSSNRKISHTSK